MNKVAPSKKTFLAIDNFNHKEPTKIIEDLSTLPLENLYGFKVGLEQYYRHGNKILSILSKKTKLQIFLDLKLHDIPNTVAKSIEALENLPINYLTIHLSGGKKMVEAARKARDRFLPNTKILGVSYLTSLSQDDFDQIWGLQTKKSIIEAMEKLYLIALDKENGCDGVVLSGQDIETFKKLENSQSHQILKVCPGIRFENEILKGLTQDQSRACTPEEALTMGADYLVMGRSLTKTLNSNTKNNPLIPDSFWQD